MPPHLNALLVPELVPQVDPDTKVGDRQEVECSKTPDTAKGLVLTNTLCHVADSDAWTEECEETCEMKTRKMKEQQRPKGKSATKHSASI